MAYEIPNMVLQNLAKTYKALIPKQTKNGVQIYQQVVVNRAMLLKRNATRCLATNEGRFEALVLIA